MDFLTDKSKSLYPVTSCKGYNMVTKLLWSKYNNSFFLIFINSLKWLCHYINKIHTCTEKKTIQYIFTYQLVKYSFFRWINNLSIPSFKTINFFKMSIIENSDVNTLQKARWFFKFQHKITPWCIKLNCF